MKLGEYSSFVKWEKILDEKAIFITKSEGNYIYLLKNGPKLAYHKKNHFSDLTIEESTNFINSSAFLIRKAICHNLQHRITNLYDRIDTLEQIQADILINTNN